MSHSRSRHTPHTESIPKKSEQNFITAAFVGALTLIIVNIVAPNLIPITSTQVWTMRGTIMEWLTVAWPLFVWGGGVTAVIGLASPITSADRQVHAGFLFLRGIAISVLAGLVEEVSFRWLIFLPNIMWVMFGNWLFGGWFALALIGLIGLATLAFGSVGKNGFIALAVVLIVTATVYVVVGAPTDITKWFHLNVWGVLADVTTGGYLHDYLFHPTGFAVGAAMLYTNAFFRDSHKYLGLVGVLNSWFLGMFFFYIMFTYGLPAAILIHFMYDVVVFSTSAFILAWRKTSDEVRVAG